MAEPSVRPPRRWCRFIRLTPEEHEARTHTQYGEAERRLRLARHQLGFLMIRIPPYVAVRQYKGYAYYALLGQALLMRVPEPIDVWDLLRDLRRFLTAWRPMRLRSPAERLAAREVIEQWEQLGASMGRDGRWQIPR